MKLELLCFTAQEEKRTARLQQHKLQGFQGHYSLVAEFINELLITLAGGSRKVVGFNLTFLP